MDDPLRHIPKVAIVTTNPESRFATGKETEIRVNGELWPTFGYKIEGDVSTVQRVTLVFAADVTVSRKELDHG